MSKNKDKKRKMPFTLYVYARSESDGTYFIAARDLSGCAPDEPADMRLVGTYELKEIGELRNSIHYQKVKK